MGSEVARQAESSQPTQPNPTQIQFTEKGDRAQEIDTRFSLDYENTNLFVERSEKGKDTDKDVDADRVRTVQPVGGHWSTKLEEVDIDFRIWIATCSCEQARKESGSLKVCSHCPSLCCTQTLPLGHVPNADPDDRQELHRRLALSFLLLKPFFSSNLRLIVKFGVTRCTPSLDVQH